MGFTSLKSNTSLLSTKALSPMYILIYMNDIIITSLDLTLIANLIRMLQITFVVKDLGSLHFFLGVKAYFTANELFLTQQNYICDLLLKSNMLTVKCVSPSIIVTTTLTQHNENVLSDLMLYRSVVCSLQYLSFTRLDNAYFVSKIC